LPFFVLSLELPGPPTFLCLSPRFAPKAFLLRFYCSGLVCLNFFVPFTEPFPLVVPWPLLFPHPFCSRPFFPVPLSARTGSSTGFQNPVWKVLSFEQWQSTMYRGEFLCFSTSRQECWLILFRDRKTHPPRFTTFLPILPWGVLRDLLKGVFTSPGLLVGWFLDSLLSFNIYTNDTQFSFLPSQAFLSIPLIHHFFFL